MNLINHSESGRIIKRFSFIQNGDYLLAKPKSGEQFRIVHDYLGDRSLLWVACIDLATEKEKWRHSVANIVRITFDNA